MQRARFDERARSVVGGGVRRASYKDRDIASARRRQRPDGREGETGEEAWPEPRRWEEAGTLLRTVCVEEG